MQKTSPVRIRMTHDEVKELEQISIELLGKKNKSRLVRKLVRDFIGFGPDLLDLQMVEFRLAVRQLSGVSNNINQIAKAVNANSNNISRLSLEQLKIFQLSVDHLNDKLLDIMSHTKARKGYKIEH